MKITKITAKRFGRFNDFSAKTNSNILVFKGNNETGKTTIWELIVGSIFGFKDNGRHKQKTLRPLIKWGHSDALISANIATDDGSSFVIERRLTPKKTEATIVGDGLSQEIDDLQIDITGGMNKDVFRSIYAINMFDLTFPGGETWEKAQVRLMSGDAVEGIRPLHDIDSEMVHDIRQIYRKENRDDEIKALIEQKNELNLTLQEARDRQRQINNLEHMIERSKYSLNDFDLREKEGNAFLNIAQRMNSFKAKYEVVEKFDELAQGLRAFESLPSDIQQNVNEIKSRMKGIEELLYEADEQLKSYNETLNFEKDEYKKVLEMEQTIEQVTSVAARMADDKKQIDDLNRESGYAMERYEEIKNRIGIREGDDFINVALGKISLSQLRDKLKKIDQLLNDIEQSKVDLHDLNDLEDNRPKFPGMLKLVGGIIGGIGLLLTLNFLIGIIDFSAPTILNILFIVMLLGGVGALVAGFITDKKSNSGLIAEKQAAISSITKNYKYEVDQTRKNLYGLTLSASRIRQGDMSLINDLELLMDRSSALGETNTKLKQINDRYTFDLNKAIYAIKTILQREPENVNTDISTLGKLLVQAKEGIMNRDNASKVVEDINHNKKTLYAQQSECTTQLDDLYDTLRSADGKTLDEKIQYVQQLRNYQSQAAIRLDQLKESNDFNENLQRLMRNRNNWPYTDNEILRVKNYADDARQNISLLNNETGQHINELNNLKKMEFPDIIESRMKELDEVITAKARKRDAMVVALGLLRRGYTNFKEKHQPDVVKRTAKYFSIITDGKYSHMSLNEDGDKLLVYADETHVGEPEYLRLSRGTIEQLYFALRLALVDHMDPQDVVLPLLLDEVMVNWDDHRFDCGMKLIKEISQTRQIMIFTCHDRMSNALKQSEIDFLEIHPK